MARGLIEQVLKTIRNYEMLPPGAVVLAAVSGGPDSVFLVYALKTLKRKLKIERIVICNLDHGLRGEESRQDSLFVRHLAEQLKLEYIHKRVDLSCADTQKRSIEELARAARYDFFDDAAKTSGATLVATGHTLDDQAETVLMRILKGASLKGLVGIPPVRLDLARPVIRPLLELEKREIEAFLKREGIEYRVDRTNLEPVYFRNKVRLEIIPFLERYNPRLKRALFNLAEHLREDFRFIQTEHSLAKALIASGGGASIAIALKDIAVQPAALQKEILRDALEKAGGEVKKLSFRHWKEIERLIKDKRAGSSIDLPGSIRAGRTDKLLTFRRI